MKILDFNYISGIASEGIDINANRVYDWCNDVWMIKEECVLPAKTKMWEGENGRYITMPCVIPQLDIAGVKFISRNIEDSNGIPARNSNIILQKRSEMGLIAVEDGIWITNMRTGAIAAHSVICFGRNGMETLGIMGLGAAARSFMYIFGQMYDKHMLVKLLRYKDQAESFIKRFENEYPQFDFEIVETVDEICACDAVVSAVGVARERFADDSVFKKGCIVVPIHQGGFQNCDICFDKVLIDDHAHVKGYKYYDQFKENAVEISEVMTGKKVGRNSDDERLIAYCGGIALHDIYIAYKLYEIACKRNDCPEVAMSIPSNRFWM